MNANRTNCRSRGRKVATSQQVGGAETLFWEEKNLKWWGLEGVVISERGERETESSAQGIAQEEHLPKTID